MWCRNAAVDFVGRYMVKARHGKLTGRFKHRKRPEKIRLDDRRWRMNAAIHVRFGGKVHDRVGPFIAHKLPYERFVADISVHEAIAIVVRYAREILEVTRIRKLV